ncbi:diaminopimelate epimerase [Mucisphaera calidilacus]|uniref:Diaminopimelate epimerase n=1 Tax=Mucisphaera calidilacus TaxID=2527982 RepID=A0A518BY62_9BACT|nr:diaminopimelate epimerase [Mucisphaera calidilacus]QDU71894.1 Diaminopimelate epimerase [Mucisphaera calidilacus]
MQFIKMHGLGNDYVYVNGFQETDVESRDLNQLAHAIADRHRGVGSDGLILALPPATASAHARMRMFNADGSEGDMCGNGIRCLAKLVHDEGVSTAKPLLIETGNGVLTVDYTTDTHGKLNTATVDMGEPRFEPQAVPLNLDHADPTDHPATWTLDLDSQPITFVAVNTGNPHAVVFVDDLTTVNLHHLGPRLEHHVAFARRANIHFATVEAPDSLRVLHWERGSGPTLACGTGATAVCVAAAATGRSDRTVTTHLPGGPLRIEWRDNNHVFMTGPAEESFRGIWPL